MQAPALLTERGFSLRSARDDDLPSLHELYASTRAGEMAMAPWPDTVKQVFLDSQFALQHQHYLSHFPDADFLVLVREGRIQGRYYVQRHAPECLLIDISLLPALRGSGIGTALIRHTQMEAAAQGKVMRLHVQQANAGARRLYERLDFVADATQGAHIPMHWQP